MIKKIRIILSSVFAAAFCVAVFSTAAFADTPAVKVSFDKTTPNNVAVYVENGGSLTDEVSAIRLTLGVELETGSLDGIEASFSMSDALNATIKQAGAFNRTTGTINVYVAGGNNLLAGKLLLGTLNITPNQSANVNFSVVAKNIDLVGNARNTIFVDPDSIDSAPLAMAYTPDTTPPTVTPGADPADPGAKPDDGGGDEKNQTPGLPPGKLTSLPQTGDNLFPVIFCICTVAALAAVVAFFGIKRSKKENR